MKSYFRVLFADRNEDFKLWIRLCKELSYNEIFYNPNYIWLFCQEGEIPVAMTWEEKNGLIVFPLILRALKKEDPFTDIDYYDLGSAYGYGGPFYIGDVSVEHFWKNVGKWANDNKIVSLFSRLTVFEEQLIPFPQDYSVINIGINIVRSLDKPLEYIWMDYEHKVRKNIKRALKENVEVFIDEEYKFIDDFISIYYSVLNRRKAANYYYFKRYLFINLLSKNPENVLLIHGAKDGKIITSELLLLSKNYIYSFLGGTLSEYYFARPNDLLKHKIIEWGINNKKAAYNVGGTIEKNEGILSFKKSFAPQGEKIFKIAFKVFDKSIYDYLIAQKKRYYLQKGVDWNPKENYYPKYRA